jgi:homoserine kinase type II
MAVYTHVPAELLAEFLKRYDVGELQAVKGIAEGVENSNYLVDTSGADGKGARFILTLYEKRVDVNDLPFFMDLLDHLSQRACPVPRFIPDRDGVMLQTLSDRPACLIEFLSGVSVTEPTAPQAHSAGAALGQLHKAAADFTGERPNSLGPDGWHRLADACGSELDEIAPLLHTRVKQELAYLDENWPKNLAKSVIHADLFPDNVLMRGNEVGGLIDFYFSCTDIRAYDVAITHGAWCFSPDGRTFHADVAHQLIAGYRETHGLTPEEYAALPILARGAALRFLLTRAYDWINTPADALVTRKYPLAYLRRLEAFAEGSVEAMFGPAA